MPSPELRGAHSRDPLASPGERCTASGTREELALAAVICPSGSFVSSPLCKNISLHPSGKSSLQIRAIPPHQRGVSRSSRTRGADAVDAAAFCARRDRRAGWRKTCERSPSERTRDADRVRRSRVVLTPRRWRQVCGVASAQPGLDKTYPLTTVAKEPDHRGEHEGNR